MKLAVIPARGGSKRIPRKNIRAFCGKPIIAWSIEAALRSGCFDRVIVSTDDAGIAEVARAHGAEVPFIRPVALSDDHTPTVPVIAHAIRWCEAEADARAIEAACCIYATAPFCRAEDLRAGEEILMQESVDYAFPVVSYGFPIQRALRITTDGHVAMFQPEHAATRSQDLEPAYHDAGQWYWGKRAAWLSERPIFSPASRPLVLPAERVQDIDTPEDWARAELMFQVLARR
ncbi:pseudaminic acid cytidylyltransferase [Wenzhouxiangella sp. XN24]|uniref:pseudaminic acid cytidylyltransferase n=1 Tax=Wenzhouxiangella sp. XN24 TaxID=2713569 RepID=UPI0013ED232B|nr:pseudaminic acid cytidylyltransferase [Wenzhouxiangella sp. XN24]NGX17175.1 pseudaminic acid cytidylyltransferase [Wenzhouxiangella sp. XN24]